jgi:hypothetical protein
MDKLIELITDCLEHKVPITGVTLNDRKDFEYRPASEVFYEMTLKYPGVKSFFNWDDGTQMDYYDWIGCVKYLMDNYMKIPHQKYFIHSLGKYILS